MQALAPTSPEARKKRSRRDTEVKKVAGDSVRLSQTCRIHWTRAPRYSEGRGHMVNGPSSISFPNSLLRAREQTMFAFSTVGGVEQEPFRPTLAFLPRQHDGRLVLQLKERACLAPTLELRLRPHYHPRQEHPCSEAYQLESPKLHSKHLHRL